MESSTLKMFDALLFQTSQLSYKVAQLGGASPDEAKAAAYEMAVGSFAQLHNLEVEQLPEEALTALSLAVDHAVEPLVSVKVPKN